MDTETTEVITPEIVSIDENDTNAANAVANIAVVGFALVGAAKIAKFAAAKVPFRVRLERTVKVVETPEVPTPTTVAAE